jgi:hypothetical protein
LLVAIKADSCWRSSAVNVTLYFFMGFLPGRPSQENRSSRTPQIKSGQLLEQIARAAAAGLTAGTLDEAMQQQPLHHPRNVGQGLPVTKSAVESLMEEFNYRVKGTEKFWNRPKGTERILQVRAAVLCKDDRLSKHVKNRPGSPQ